MLTGKMTKQSEFAADDHRNFNRQGGVFDVGETFSGVDYDVALSAVEELRKLVLRSGHVDAAVCAEVDPYVRCGELRDSGREAAGAGGG